MIKLEKVSRVWPGFAIRDLTLQVDEGQYLFVVGPTGAGKTLLLEILLGIHHPDTGRIFIGESDVTDLPPEKRGIGMVYQDYLLFPHLDVAHNLAFGLRYRRCSRAERKRKVSEIAESLGIGHLLHRYPYTMSGGEKQRVAIGRALITKPRVLLLDEPLSALDWLTASRLRSELKSLHINKKLTVLHVTHDLSETRKMSGQVALINRGRLDAIGCTDDLQRRPPTVFAAQFFGAVNLYKAVLENISGGMCAVAGPFVAESQFTTGSVHVMIRPDEVILLPITAKVEDKRLRGEVVALTDEGDYVSVQLRLAGLPTPLTAFVSRKLFSCDLLRLGVFVWTDVTKAIHVLRDGA